MSLSKNKEIILPTEPEARKAALINIGNTTFGEVNGRTQTEICQIFVNQDEAGLKQLIDIYGHNTVEGLALVADDAITTVIGEESSLHDWVSDLNLQSQG